MNQTVYKNFLTPLFPSMQQDLLSTSFAFDLARNAGLYFKTKGNFEEGAQLTGTNQDDTIIIGGNLMGGNDEITSIELLGGNDTLTIGGDITAQNARDVLISSDSGNKTITVNGGIKISDSHVGFGFNDNSSTNVINIAKDISQSYAIVEFDMDGYSSTLNIDGKIYANNNCDVDIYSFAENNIVNIKGGLTAINSCIVGIVFRELPPETKSHSTEFNIGGELFINSSSMSIQSYSDITKLSFSDITITNSSSVYFDILKPNASISDCFIDGNITVTDNCYFSIQSNTRTNFELAGSITIQDSNADLAVYGGNISILGGISTTNGRFSASSDDTVGLNFYIEGNVIANTNEPSGKGDGSNSFSLSYNNSSTFTLVGNLSATNNATNQIFAGKGKDLITIIGDISVVNGGKNTIDTDSGDDIINLNGHIDVGAFAINAGEGNDTLVLTANTQKLFEADYKEWLTDLSTSGSLAKSSIETIRVDVNFLQPNKLGWLTDIVNKANADGAHIAVEDKAGHQLVNPSTYLAQGNDTHNPINDVLDHYAPAAANTVQPKTFAETVTGSSTDAFTAPHFDNSNFLHEMEQQAQAQAAVAA